MRNRLNKLNNDSENNENVEPISTEEQEKIIKSLEQQNDRSNKMFRIAFTSLCIVLGIIKLYYAYSCYKHFVVKIFSFVLSFFLLSFLPSFLLLSSSSFSVQITDNLNIFIFIFNYQQKVQQSEFCISHPHNTLVQKFSPFLVIVFELISSFSFFLSGLKQMKQESILVDILFKIATFACLILFFVSFFKWYFFAFQYFLFKIKELLSRTNILYYLFITTNHFITV